MALSNTLSSNSRISSSVEQAMVDGATYPEQVNAEHIAAQVVGDRAGIPITPKMLESERERLLHLEEIGNRVYGQPEATDAVSVRHMRTDLQVDHVRRLFLFVGPTGVGKTNVKNWLGIIR